MKGVCVLGCFFFSSRRRHTRWTGDWSSDVCSSDLEEAKKLAALGYVGTPRNRSGPLPDPRDEIGHLPEIKAAFHLADLRRDDEAIPAFRALLERNPHLQDVWSKLGEVLVDS